jgi:hypothetical protein
MMSEENADLALMWRTWRSDVDGAQAQGCAALLAMQDLKYLFLSMRWRWFQGLLGLLLAMIKCSICSYQRVPHKSRRSSGDLFVWLNAIADPSGGPLHNASFIHNVKINKEAVPAKLLFSHLSRLVAFS